MDAVGCSVEQGCRGWNVKTVQAIVTEVCSYIGPRDIGEGCSEQSGAVIDFDVYSRVEAPLVSRPSSYACAGRSIDETYLVNWPSLSYREWLSTYRHSAMTIITGILGYRILNRAIAEAGG